MVKRAIILLQCWAAWFLLKKQWLGLIVFNLVIFSIIVHQVDQSTTFRNLKAFLFMYLWHKSLAREWEVKMRISSRCYLWVCGVKMRLKDIADKVMCPHEALDLGQWPRSKFGCRLLLQCWKRQLQSFKWLFYLIHFKLQQNIISCKKKESGKD